MPFLTLRLEVAPHQERAAQAASAPGGASWYRALLRAIFPEHEETGELRTPYGSSTHITVTPLAGGKGGHRVRVTLSGRDALNATHALLSALTERPVLHCERRPYRVLSAGLAGPVLPSVSSWGDLLAPTRSARPAICLRFVTPAIFAGPGEGSPQGELFPQPLQVFSGLLDRWSHLGGPALPPGILPWLQSYGCMVADYRLRAEPIAPGGASGSPSACLGWQGWVTYTCREPQPEFTSPLRALARLACFTGVGDRTEVGLGMIQIIESGSGDDGMARS
jgi:CRISPR-associated endoribonuclease Cas6